MSVDVKRCLNCNRLFGPRTKPNGKTEYPSAFKTKRYCSPTCGAIASAAARKLVCDDAEMRA